MRSVFNVNDPEIEIGDSGGDFEKLPPDQLYPSAIRDQQVHTANSVDSCSYARVSRLCIDPGVTRGDVSRWE